MKPLVVVMGVSGSGKSTVGRRLAGRLGVPFEEGDDLHPRGNVSKMASGRPLDDADRGPWLDAVARLLAADAGSGAVVACSALRRRYRDRLRAAAPDAVFVHLDGSPELVADRLAARSGHFMPASLLHSQVEALEPLQPDERGVTVSVDGEPGRVAERALAGLGALPERADSPGAPDPRGSR